ncbi:hypothetical protein HanRHA438_Chr14g0673511 [Helianthus annuus]|nr:hypothetical protein HanHA300_Chr14g0539791 [Helianthus annuus]KAJ0470432.1 hypothetical protein HanIR_Chr14g0718751 [Helianthus annuus]KAJ0487170.1 hypothetical protein HanHA89_Chr14g0587561 [Helianthus annuus]KAJ0855447.1 hypothetical protein HanRHA438_Chr14g0673511 [Helianthus annuus]
MNVVKLFYSTFNIFRIWILRERNVVNTEENFKALFPLRYFFRLNVLGCNTYTWCKFDLCSGMKDVG